MIRCFSCLRSGTGPVVRENAPVGPRCHDDHGHDGIQEQYRQHLSNGTTGDHVVIRQLLNFCDGEQWFSRCFGCVRITHGISTTADLKEVTKICRSIACLAGFVEYLMTASPVFFENRDCTREYLGGYEFGCFTSEPGIKMTADSAFRWVSSV